MKVNYTPFANHSDTELLREVWNREEVTDLELELAERLDYYIEYAATLLEEAGHTSGCSGGGCGATPNTRYKEAA